MKNKLFLFRNAVTFLCVYLCFTTVAQAGVDLDINYCGTVLLSGTYTYNNIIVEPGACLQIEPGANITVNGDIVVKRGGKLWMDGTTVNFYGDMIVVLPAAKLSIVGSTINMDNGFGGGFFSIESDYVNTGGYGFSSIPDVGGQLYVSKSSIIGNWEGMGISGGNGHKNPFNPYNNSFYFSQNGTSSGANVYTASAVFINSTIAGMQFGIDNWDRYGTALAGRWGWWYQDPVNQFSCGGLIQANWCNFSGNGLAFNFESYRNWSTYPMSYDSYSSSVLLRGDFSFIKNCNFSSSIGLGYSWAQGYIYTEDIHGLQVLGCSFTNPLPYNTAYFGLNINNSDVTIDQSCNDIGAIPISGCAHIGPSKFTDLAGYGIIATGGSVNVSNTYFQGIPNAVYLTNTNGTTVLNNQVLPAFAGNSNGISIEGASSFSMQGNTVQKVGTSPGTPPTVGILINDATSNPTQVYKNTISNPADASNTWYPIQANGKNYNSTFGSGSIGLTFVCNDLSSNVNSTSNDITVAATLPAVPGPGLGIASLQLDGTTSSSKAAANVWNPYASKNFINLDEGLLYYYFTTPQIPTFLLGTMSIHSSSLNNTCPTGLRIFTGGPFGIYMSAPPSGIALPYATYEAHKSTLETTIASTSTSSPAYADLLNQYGKLSDSALAHFTHPDLDSVQQYIGDSTYIHYAIDSLFDSVSMSHKYDTTVWYGDSVTATHLDSIILILSNIHYLYQYQMQLADVYAQQGDFASAFTTLGNITSNFTLNAAETRDLSNIIYLYGVKDSIHSKGNYDSLSSTDTTLLGHIARDSSGQARYMAQGILHSFAAVDFPPEIYNPSNKPAGVASVTQGIAISISPNPFAETITIAIKNYDGSPKAIIYDIKGVVVLEAGLNSNGNTVLDTKMLAPGSYIVRILNNQRTISTKKIVKEQ